MTQHVMILYLNWRKMVSYKSTKGNIIRLSPPLIIDKTHIEQALSIFERVFL